MKDQIKEELTNYFLSLKFQPKYISGMIKDCEEYWNKYKTVYVTIGGIIEYEESIIIDNIFRKYDREQKLNKLEIK